MEQAAFNDWSLVVSIASFIVSIVAVGVLAWYTLETKKLRLTSQEQVKVALEQVEATNKPCIMMALKLRDLRDTLVDADDAVGSLEIDDIDVNFLMQNIGTGVALNVTYFFRVDSKPHRERYAPIVRAGARQQFPEVTTVNHYSGKYEVVFNYESISGRKYQSIVSLNKRVMTRFDFKAL